MEGWGAKRTIFLPSWLVILSTTYDLWHFYDICFFVQVSFRMMIYVTVNAFLYIKSVYWHEINMVVVFLCIYCTKIIHSNELFPTRKRLAFRACAADNFRHQHFCSLFWMYQTKFEAKITKSKWIYTANMIMNVSGAVCKHIHYFPGKQGLAIDLTWPALKVNNARAFWYYQMISVDSHLVGIWSYYKIHNK